MPIEPPDGETMAAEIEGGTAGIAGVDGCIDLEKVVKVPEADVAGAGRDDARRHRTAEPERIADGENPFADPRCLVGQLDGRKFFASFHLEQCEVRLWIGAHQLGGIALAVIGGDFD